LNFANLFYGADTTANRQFIVDNQLLDDFAFNITGHANTQLYPSTWSKMSGTGGCIGISYTTSAHDLNYSCLSTVSLLSANTIDNYWFQTSPNIGDTVYDL